MSTALVGLGSNVADRLHWLSLAIDKLRALAGTQVVGVSSWHESIAAGGPAGQAAFLNGCALLETSLAPMNLLHWLLRVEGELGRERKQHWGPRTIDLDLLLYDDRRISSPTLIVPHPRMAWRRFVVEPAAEIAPSLRHPVLSWTMARLRDHLRQSPRYLAISGAVAAGKSALAASIAARHDGVLLEEHFSREHLQTFYADPDGQAWNTEIEFLAQRAADLDGESALWKDRERLIVSDYWFNQSAAFAHVWLPHELQAAYSDRWQEVRKHVVQPRLTILIDMPTGVLLDRIAARGRSGEEALDAARLDQLRCSLQRQTLEEDAGPVMPLAGDRQAEWESEISAAVIAMT